MAASLFVFFIMFCTMNFTKSFEAKEYTLKCEYKKIKHMRELGRVISITKTGKIIVKINSMRKVTRLGSRVYDERLTPIGRIYDVMGPVSSPYVSVRPEIPGLNPEKYVGRMLFVEEIKPKKMKRKKRRRR